MTLGEAISQFTRFSPPAVPELRYIEAAAQRVHDRWPDVSVNLDSREREELAVRLRDQVARNDWKDARISFVIAAASAVFDPERRDRSDLVQARSFLLDELRASRSATSLSGMLSVYLESYSANGPHTRAIAKVLDAIRDRMSPSARNLLMQVPELLDAADGPRRLAGQMARMKDPFLELSRVGLRNPHGPGFMAQAHLVFSDNVKPELTTRTRIDWYINWIRPPSGKPLSTGAERAIEALTHPWLHVSPPDDLRSYLVEVLIETYGDPRIQFGGIWGAVDPANKQLLERWLTREDMRFFTGVVDAAQKDAMWPPRRDFWLRLFDEKRIDAAWVAFSSQAAAYARAHLMREDARNADSRFGFQRARQNTSLLIMKIGNKVFVDGCHSYKTHVFAQSDNMAPKLFQEGYDCDEIMRASPESKSHSSIDSWQRWVRDMINADLRHSHRTTPYSKVYRPRPLQPRVSQPARTYAPTRSRVLPRQFDFDLGARTPQTAAPTQAAISGPVRVQASVTPAARAQAQPPSARVNVAQSTLDLMIRMGAPGAKAILDHFDAKAGGTAKSLLSPTARAGLEWIIASKGPLPEPLRNSLTHLLISMETYGQGPVGILARAASKPASEAPRPSPLPPLPQSPSQRLDLLLKHADAMDALARGHRVLSGDRELGIALAKLKSRDPNLRPVEIHSLQKLYEELRRNGL